MPKRESSDSDDEDILNPRAGLRKLAPHLSCDESIAPTCSSLVSSKRSQKLKSRLSLSQKQREAGHCFKRETSLSFLIEEPSFLKEENSPSNQNGSLQQAKSSRKDKSLSDNKSPVPFKKLKHDVMLSSSSSDNEEIPSSQKYVQKRIVRTSDIRPLQNRSIEDEDRTCDPPPRPNNIYQSPIKCGKGILCENISKAHRNAYVHVESDSIESVESSVISLSFPKNLSGGELNETNSTCQTKLQFCEVRSIQSPTTTFSASGDTKEDFVQHWVDSLEIGETEKIVDSGDEDTLPLVLSSEEPPQLLFPDLPEPDLSYTPYYEDHQEGSPSKNKLIDPPVASTSFQSDDDKTQPLFIPESDDSTDVPIPSVPSIEDQEEKKRTPPRELNHHPSVAKTPVRETPKSRGMVTPRRRRGSAAKPSSSSGKQTAITAYYTPQGSTSKLEKPTPIADVSQVQKNTNISELMNATLTEEVEVETIAVVEEVAVSNRVEDAKEKWSYIMSRMNMRGTATNLQREIKQAKNQKTFKEPKQIVSQNGGEANPSAERKCPFYKRIPNTGFAIDAFCYGRVKGVTSYFLSHFHYDHYRGLGKWLDKPLYCSQVTANLVNMKIKPNPNLIKVLPLNESVVIENVEVVLIDANHCPGSVMFLFRFPTGKAVLHVGDFRAHPKMETLKELIDQPISELYLDTTYCDEHYELPSQEEVLAYIRRLVRRYSRKHENLLVVSGTYTIGKEKVFMTAAEELDSKVWAPTEKRRVLSCLDDLNICARLAKDPLEARVHVVNMGDIKPANLKKYLDSLKGTYTHILALNPTGWEYDGQTAIKGLDAIQPKTYHGSIFIHGVPYSEHSGFSEMKRFVRHFKPRKIIPTVNMGSAAQRQKMETIFTKWLGHPAR